MRIVLIYVIIITCPPPLVKHIFSIGYIFSFWGMMDGMRNCRGAPWSPMAFAFAKAMPPAAAPHISHPLVPKSQWMTASPPRGGRSLCPVSNTLSLHETMRSLQPKGFSLEGEAVKARFPKNRALTDVGDLPPSAAGGRPRVTPTASFLQNRFC